MILAVDPGSEKCGLALLNLNANLIERKIISRENAAKSIAAYLAQYAVSTLVVGQSPFGKDLEKELSKMELKTNLIFISEKFSTLAARKRYWQENQPKGLWKLIPVSLRTPPAPVDDYAAQILGERYLKS